MQPLPARAPLAVLTFNQDATPCEPARINAAYEPLTWAAQRASQGGYRCESASILADAPADRTDGTAAHRYLLAQSKGRGNRWGTAYTAVKSSLENVRPHSSLYTPRTCECLHRALVDFSVRVDDVLNALARTGPEVWARVDAVGGGSFEDIDGPIGFGTLLYGARPMFDSSEMRAVRRRCGSRLRLEVTVRGPAEVEVVWGAGRARRVERLRQLEGDRARVARALRYGGARSVAAAAWVLEWPSGLAELALAMTSGRSSDVRSLVTDLLAAGFADLHPDARETAVRLAPGWPGTVPELVTTLRAVIGQGTAKY